MRNRKLPPALHRWCEEVEVRRQLRRAVSGIGNAPLRMAYNTWFATVSTAAEARAAVEKALMSIVSPEVRAVRKGFNSWLEVYAQVCLMRKAGLPSANAGCVPRSTRGFLSPMRSAFAMHGSVRRCAR
jgi:hypothetical protein